MVMFCPICESEFQKGVELCPTHKVPLQKALKTKTGAVAVDIYAAKDEIEAERIVSFLNDEGIETVERETIISQLPGLSDMRFLVTVPIGAKKRATDLLKGARHDGIISTLGIFL